MKTLNENELEMIQGGVDQQAAACGIAVGLCFTPWWIAGAVAFALFCLTGDTKQE
ncbi:MAG: hypothetical protein LBU22_10785 [Dysgonamonadaceae bacterium]|jgi:bacteriocin-like protein|nr:hypothetical protein [Dysgonamonadaceae bacterium]